MGRSFFLYSPAPTLRLVQLVSRDACLHSIQLNPTTSISLSYMCYLLYLIINLSNMSASQESPGHDIEHAPVTSVLQDGDIPLTKQVMSEDERVITALGYKQEFKREFSLWTTFCVSFAVLGLLPSFASTVYYGNCFYLLVSCVSEALTISMKEWATQEQQAWSGAGLLLWFSSNVWPWQWQNCVPLCRPGILYPLCRIDSADKMS